MQTVSEKLKEMQKVLQPHSPLHLFLSCAAYTRHHSQVALCRNESFIHGREPTGSGGLGQKFSPGTVATPAHITTPTQPHPRTHAFTTYIYVQMVK